jgi:peptidoglycan/LPS O-acetylase OafA/YrhL
MLRGLASSFVFFYHVMNISGDYIGNELLSSIAYYGKFGIQFFFVISGFVICFSMINSRFQTKDYFTFLKKRIVRIEPPYLLVLLLTVIYIWVRAKTGLGHGDLPMPDWKQVLLHIGYLIPFSSYGWLNVVFWTLAIEFQFYLFFPLIFEFFIRYKSVRWTLTACLVAIFFISQSVAFFIYWSPVFLLGINLALYKKNKISLTELWVLFALLSAFIFYKLGLTIAIFTDIPFLLILFEPALKVRVLNFLGRISYSVYLLHTLVAFAFINYAISHSIRGFKGIILFSLAISLTLLSSWLLYHFVEKPCQKWASAIRYKS